ncbi:MAG: hypothetical protein WCA46_14060 [Actinocatenispora sp.]
MAPSLQRAEVEQAFAGLSAARDEAAAVMYQLDSHPALTLLRDGTTAGETLELWTGLQSRIRLAWAHFNTVGDLLEAARAVRARRHRPSDEDLTELAALLRGPVIGFDAAGLPSDGSGAPAVRRVTLGELLHDLVATSTGLIGELSGVQRSVDAVTARLAGLADQLGAVRAAAAGVTDEAVGRTLGSLTDILEETRAAALTDPLRAAPGGSLEPSTAARLDRLSGALTEVRARLTELTAIRTGFADRRAGLVTQLTAVVAAETAARTAYGTVAVKIADPGLPPVPAEADSLRRRLDGLDELHRGAAWARLTTACASMERDLTAATERATALANAADGLLARRDELRGRLDAYRAKAARLGLVEHDTLTERHGVAQRLLYTAPCDLPAGTRAVFAYQQALADLATPRKEST